MSKLKTVIGFSVVLACQLSLAQGSTSAAKLEESEDGAQTSKVKAQDLKINKKYQADTEITDPRLQADAGSLSKFSSKFNLTYYGPMIGDLSAKDQPNPDGRVLKNNQTAISGNIGLQYRLTPKDSLATGTGIKGIYPMQGFDGVQTNTPYLSYSHFTKWHGIQLRQTPEFDVVTLPGYKMQGEDYSFSYGLGSVYDLGQSRFALGLDMTFGYYHFSHQWIKTDGKANNGSVYTYPSLKYNFNNRTQFMTSFTIGWIQPRDLGTNPTENLSKLVPQTVKQSFGVSYSFTRDIYFYPYLNFYPAKLNTDNTTINVSTIFSIL